MGRDNKIPVIHGTFVLSRLVPLSWAGGVLELVCYNWMLVLLVLHSLGDVPCWPVKRRSRQVLIMFCGVSLNLLRVLTDIFIMCLVCAV